MKKTPFIGRESELKILRSSFRKLQKSSLTAVYGRRRVGKTRLVFEAHKDCTLFHFEGLEGENSAAQKKHFIKTLYRYSKNEAHRLISSADWEDLLMLLAEYIPNKPCVVFFDEFQWMAAERTELISKLKFVWDNYFQKKTVHLILCGSISSFLVKKVIRSRALYGRIDRIIHLLPLTFKEVYFGFLKKRSIREALEWYLVAGGIPKYIELLDMSKSIRLNMHELFFHPDSYFLDEYDRLFISHFGKRQHYKKIVEFLAIKKFAMREEISRYIGLKPGGRLSEVLENLLLAGFIEEYSPLHLQGSIHVKRYRIADAFLRFYFKFIAPVKMRITKNSAPLPLHLALPDKKFDIFLGFAFEYFCYQHSGIIAEKLGFSAVNYEYGSWFTKKNLSKGVQIDLLFKRADNVITVCEIKFSKKVNKKVIDDVEKKVQIIDTFMNETFEKVLISVYSPDKAVYNTGYFSKILTLEDLFGIS